MATLKHQIDRATAQHSTSDRLADERHPGTANPPAERNINASRRRSKHAPKDSSTVLGLIERVALDPRADVEKLERVMAMYERLKAKDAELAYNATKGRILKKLARIKIVKNRSALYEIEKGKPQKGTYEAFKYAPGGDRQTIAPTLGGTGYGSLLFRRAAGGRHPHPRSSEAPAGRPPRTSACAEILFIAAR
jgi:hypothetical protein